MNWRIHRHGDVDSTSERAFASLAEGSARHGDVHVAAAQSAGRGRLGRRWESAAGEGLYVSVVLLPPAHGPPPPALTLAGGLGVLEGVEGLGLAGAHLAWPNDLMLGQAKLAGVLIESRGFDPARPAFVLGIGLNVRQRSFPADLERERSVTSLALAGLDVSVDAALEALLTALAPRLTQALCGAPALGADFLRRSGLLGPVEVEVAQRRLRGVLMGLDPRHGSLTLGTPGGPLDLPLAHVRGVRPLG